MRTLSFILHIKL